MSRNSLDLSDKLKAGVPLTFDGVTVVKPVEIPAADLKTIISGACDFFGTFTGKRPPIYPIGLPIVDDNLGGLYAGQIYTIGARTGVGKTSTALLLALRAARDGQHPVGFVPLEDSLDLIAAKAAALLGRFDDSLMQRNLLTDIEKQRLRRWLDSDDMPRLYTPAQVPRLSIEYVLQYVDTLADQGCKVIFVDYLQGITKPPAYASEQTALAYFLNCLQEKARERDVALVIISQVNRPAKYFDKSTQSYVVDDRRPYISDLKGSQEIEAKSRLIVLLWAEAGMIRAYVAKASYGPGEGAECCFVRDESGVLKLLNGVR